jgi:tetratricopeptide (TPR) repeat protein
MLQVSKDRVTAAYEAYRANDDTTMRNLVNEVAAMADGAVQAQPNNAAIYLSAGQVYFDVANVERMVRGDHQKWLTRGKEAIARARELVKPGDEKYPDIQVAYAGILMTDDQKLAEAEAVLREVVKTHPKEYQTKVRLAELIGRDPKRRDEAIALLTEPLPPAKEQKGLEALTVREFEAQSLMMLLEIQLNDYPNLKEPAERQQGLAKMEADYAKLKSMIGERPDVMMVYGRLQMTRGDVPGAVQTFSTALRAPERMTDRNRLRTLAMLSEAYIATGQSGLAKRTLNELLAMLSTPEGEERSVPQRLRLVSLLLDENNAEEARPHVDVLVKYLKPDDPRLIVARIGVMTDEAQKAERKKLFDALPQDTRAHTLDKARVAAGIMKDDETALRLLEGLRATDPADIDVVVQLANFYVSKNKKDQAEKVIADALAKQPDNIQLQMAQKRLAATTPEQMQAVRQEAVEQITDPFRKEIRLFDIALNENKIDQARAHLLAAEKLKGDDPNLIDLMYRFHASQKEFDKAQQYLDRLAQKDPGRGEIERINLALARGDRAGALELAQKLTRDRGEFAVSYLKLADVHTATGRFPEAIAAYRSALERDSRNLEALVGIIQCYYRVGQPTESRRYIETARRIYPNHARVREIALGHEEAYGDAEQVIAPRQEDLNADKENPAKWLALGQAYISAYRGRINAGKEADAKAHLAKAEDLLKQANAKWPDSLEFATALAQVELRLQKYDDGAKVIRDLAARPLYQGKMEPDLLLADYFMAAGKDADAEAIYKKLLDQTKDVSLELRLAELINRKPQRLNDALAVMELNRDHPAVRAQRIEMLLGANRIDDAQKELDAAVAAGTPANLTPEQAKTNQAAMHDLQAQVHLRANRPVEALEAVNKALAADPNFATALYHRGLLRLNTKGDPQGAIEDFSAARNVAPGLTEARVELARAYRAANDPDSAIRELESASRDVPTDKKVRLALVRSYSEAVPARWTDAERVIREAREIPVLARDVDLLQEEARMWSARNDTQRAIKVIQEVAQAAPQNLGVVQTLLEILNKGKQYREVIRVTDNLNKTSPTIWWSYQARGIAKARMDDKDGALTEFQQAMKVAEDANNDFATQMVVANLAQELGSAAALRRVEEKAKAGDNRWRMVAAKLLHMQADYVGALRYVQQILDDPKLAAKERVSVMQLAGELYCNQSPPDFARALDVFKKLVAEDPENVAALNNLAAVMTMPGSPSRPEEALQYSEKAYNLMSRGGAVPDPAVLDTHGSILVQVGRVDEGIGLLQAAIERKPIPDAYYHLGDALLRQSKPDDAETALRRARDLIAQAERDKQPVDPTLRQRVEEALIRASALKQQKTSEAR